MARVEKMNSVNYLPIQTSGRFLIMAPDKTIVGLSENMLTSGSDIQSLLGIHLPTFLESLFDLPSELSTILNDISQIPTTGTTFVVKDNDSAYYLHLCAHKGHFFIRIEEKIEEVIFSKQINAFHFSAYDNAGAMWHTLINAVQHISAFDVITVAQIFEDRTSKILYSTCTESSFAGKLFSKTFISDALYTFFSGNESIYIPDMEDREQKLCTRLSLSHIPIEYSPLPQKPKFSKLIGASSTLAIPIVINNILWGIVIGINRQPKKIDYQKRVLCQLLVQNAAIRQKQLLNQKGESFYAIIKETKNQLDEQLTSGRSLNYCLLQHLDSIASLAHADGVAIYHHGVITKQGSVPSNKQISKMVDIIRQTGKNLFKDNNFRLKRKQLFDEPLRIAGVAALRVADERDHWIIWFRNESKFTILELEESKAIKEDESKQEFILTETEILDTAIFWNDEDISFMKSLDRMIGKAVFLRTKEEAKTREILISTNNELQMITHTLSHDLKNPLSSAKLSVAFFQRQAELSQMHQRWLSNLEKSVNNMEEIINKTVEFMRSKSFSFVKEQIAIHLLIQPIFEECKIKYDNPTCLLSTADLRPVYGEKGTLTQIFSAIIGNAVQYSAHSQDPEIIINSIANAQGIVYTISDNGIGIPEEELFKVKSAFYRAQNTPPTTSGSGIGLTLASRLMQMLGGDLRLESKLGKGTTVRLRFPNE